MIGSGLHIETVAMSGTYQALAAEQLVLDVTLQAPAGNAEDVLVRVDGGDPADWPAGFSARFERIDLSRITVRGAEGDVLLVSGNTH